MSLFTIDILFLVPFPFNLHREGGKHYNGEIASYSVLEPIKPSDEGFVEVGGFDHLHIKVALTIEVFSLIFVRF